MGNEDSDNLSTSSSLSSSLAPSSLILIVREENLESMHQCFLYLLNDDYNTTIRDETSIHSDFFNACI